MPTSTLMVELAEKEIRDAVRVALAEDLVSGDATSLACIEPDRVSSAFMRARTEMVLAGIEFALQSFRQTSPNTKTEVFLKDGQSVSPGANLLHVSGPARAILGAERVALNFVQRLSGVATLTRRFVDAVRGTGTRILDTRKTTPGWRRFEKYAVTCGGGENHRMGLHDRILIKDNHLAALAGETPNAIACAVDRARKFFPSLIVEVEVDNSLQLAQAVEAGADWVLLDNMSPAQLRDAVKFVGKRLRTEASGGINLNNVRAVAESGVDYISIGALTHSAVAVDIGLDFEP